MITIKADPKDIEEYNHYLSGLAARSMKGFKQFTQQRLKLFGVRLMNLTPPFANGVIPTGGAMGTRLADRKQGLESAKRDILRTMTPPSVLFKDGYKNKQLEQWVKKKQNHKIQAYFKNLKNSELNNWTVVPFDKKWHINRRERGSRYRPTLQRKFVNDENKLKQYIREKQKWVGHMKAGWGHTILKFGGRLGGWIANLVPTSQGYAEVLEDSADSYSVEIGNRTRTTARMVSNFNIALRMETNTMRRQLEDYLKKKKK